ncbi:MAG: hypothetical protein R3F11_20260 [Verrucomicrobiales bacterium]
MPRRYEVIWSTGCGRLVNAFTIPAPPNWLPCSIEMPSTPLTGSPETSTA